MREFIYHRTNDWQATPLETIMLIAIVLGIVLLVRTFSGTIVGMLFALAAFAGFIFDEQLYIPAAILIAVAFTYVSWLRSGRSATRYARPWLTLVLDLGVAAAGFVLYELGRIATNDGERMACANADRLIRLQDALGLPREARLQQWVINHEIALEIVNFIYSFMFLSVVIGSLVWLYLNNFPLYRHVRNAMGLATLISLSVFALYPMAPPRLMTESGLVDSHARVGLRHGYMNQFAAMPSLHIGWLALVGWGLWAALRRVHGVLLGLLPASAMMVAVVATGNHFWLDGVVGAAICLGAVALTLPRPAARVAAQPQPESHARIPAAPLTVGTMLVIRARVRNTIWVLAGLMLFTVIGRLVDPVFTPYWGYLAGQIAVLALVIVVLETRSRRRALLSPSTYAIIALAMTVDVLGTAGHMYDRADFYDKIVHLMGTAAVTAVIHDLFQHRGWGRRLLHPNSLAVIAVALGIAVGGVWELYEVFGDVIFATARNGGYTDTSHDLLFDSIGAILAAIVLTWRLGECGDEVRPLTEPASPHGATELASGGQ